MRGLGIIICLLAAALSLSQAPPRAYPQDRFYEPKLIDRVADTVQSPHKSMGEIIAVIFSCMAMICTLFSKRVALRNVIKTKSTSLVNEVGIMAEGSREIAIIAFTVFFNGEFHNMGELTVALIINTCTLLLSIYYAPANRREMYLAVLIAMVASSSALISSHTLPSLIIWMPYLGSLAFILFRLTIIQKAISTGKIVGTATYRAMYLSAISLTLRISSFISAGIMNVPRIIYVGLPWLVTLLIVCTYHKYDVKEPLGKSWEADLTFTQTSSDVSFSKKSK